jgi:hypothetical protein
MIRAKAWMLAALTTAAIVGGCAKLPPATTAASLDRHALATVDYQWYNANYHRVSGCLPLGNQSIRFLIGWPNHERSMWDLLAKTTIAACTTTDKMPVRGGWLAVNPPSGNVGQVVWKNIDTGEWGYMVADPDTYAVYTNGTTDVRVMAPETSARSYWRSNGYTIGIYAYNPTGSSSWLTNQRGVLFSFEVFQ